MRTKVGVGGYAASRRNCGGGGRGRRRPPVCVCVPGDWGEGDGGGGAPDSLFQFYLSIYDNK